MLSKFRLLNETETAFERTALVHWQDSDSNEASINACAVESKSVDILPKEHIDLNSTICALKEKVSALEAELSQKNAEYKQLEQCREAYFEKNTASLKQTLIDQEKEIQQLQQFEHHYSEIYLKNQNTNQTLTDRKKEVQQPHQELQNLQTTIFTLDRFKSNDNI